MKDLKERGIIEMQKKKAHSVHCQRSNTNCAKTIVVWNTKYKDLFHLPWNLGSLFSVDFAFDLCKKNLYLLMFISPLFLKCFN